MMGVSENSAQACLRMLRTSRWKLNLVAKYIRGKNVHRALKDLDGVRKRSAGDVKKLLLSAIANAENNHGLDIDSLKIKEATVGRNFVIKRPDIRGRSRMGRIKKEFSQLRIVLVQEKE